MAKKGRPFTYQSDDDRPVTISVRLPAELTDLVKRYAATHGQMPISELIREGLEWRIGDGDPRGMGMYLREPTDRTDKSYDCNTAIAPAPHGDKALQEVRDLLSRQWEQIQALAQALERQKVLPSDGVYSSNTAIEAAVANISHNNNTVIQETATKHRGRKMPATVLQAAQNPALASVEMPPFDTTRFYLGKLCPKGHDFESTGMSLLRKHNQSCRDCENERKKARRQAQRQALAASSA